MIVQWTTELRNQILQIFPHTDRALQKFNLSDRVINNQSAKPIAKVS